jgi:hypothetical protein
MIEFNEMGSSSSGQKSNIITENVKIVDAVMHYNEQQKWQKFPNDIGVTLTLDIGRDFQPNWYLGGVYKKEPTSGEIQGWSSVFSCGLVMLFKNIGINLECPKGQTTTSAIFPDQLVEALKGKEVCRLKYLSSVRTDKNGEPKWVEFNTTSKVGDDTALIAKFHKDVEGGYVKDFLDPSTPNANPVSDHPLASQVNEAFAGDGIDDGLPV